MSHCGCLAIKEFSFTKASIPMTPDIGTLHSLYYAYVNNINISLSSTGKSQAYSPKGI